MSSELPSGLPETVHDEEDLARFITSSRQFRKSDKSVKEAALRPNKNGETSVFRHGKQPLTSLWDLADQNISGRTVHGAAIFKARSVRKAELEVIVQEPPPRHANIVNWPMDSDRNLERARQKERALLIAKEAELILR